MPLRDAEPVFPRHMSTFLDKVCVSVAGPRVQTELRIFGDVGYVVGVFAVVYGIFQTLPTSSVQPVWSDI